MFHKIVELFYCKYDYVDNKVLSLGYLPIENFSLKSFRQELTGYVKKYQQFHWFIDWYAIKNCNSTY